MKFLLWAAIIVGVIWILRSKIKSGRANIPTQKPTPADSIDDSGEPMPKCAYCNVHFPLSEAVADASGAVFCGDAHRRLHAVR